MNAWRCWSSTDDAVCRVPARGERRRGQPQDGRGGRRVGGGRLQERQDDPGERQRAAREPVRRRRRAQEGREGAARRIRLTTPGCWPTTWIPCGRSPTPIRSTAKSTATTATSRSSPTTTCSTNWRRWPRTPVPHEKIKRGKGVIYWQVPNKGTLDTTIGKTMGKKRYKSSTTTRNLRTLDKVLR